MSALDTGSGKLVHTVSLRTLNNRLLESLQSEDLVTNSSGSGMRWDGRILHLWEGL